MTSLTLLELAKMSETKFLALDDEILDTAVGELVIKGDARQCVHEHWSPATRLADEMIVRWYIGKHYPDFSFNYCPILPGGEYGYPLVEFRERDKHRDGCSYGPVLPSGISSGRFVCLWALSIVRHLVFERAASFYDVLLSEEGEP